MALGYIQNKDEAEDIFQNCVLDILNRRDTIYLTDIRNYFASMIKYSCFKYLDKHRRSSSLESESARKFWQDHIDRLSEKQNEDTQACRMDFQEMFLKCRELMPELTFKVFEAKRIEKMSYRQISEAYGISESRINFEITKALKIFRKVFRDYNIFGIMMMLYAFSSTGSNVLDFRTDADAEAREDRVYDLVLELENLFGQGISAPVDEDEGLFFIDPGTSAPAAFPAALID